MFGVATLAPHWMLRRSCRPLIKSDPRHRMLLLVWLATHALVTIQMAWVLRPFIGYPAAPVSFFRGDAWGNAYVELFQITRASATTEAVRNRVKGECIAGPQLTNELDWNAGFGMPSGQKEGCGFPVAHLLVLFSASTGLLLDEWMSPLRTADAAQAAEAHVHLWPGDILIGDDTFGGYAHLAGCVKNGLHGLFRSHHLRIVDFAKGRPHTTEGKDPVAGLPRSRWIESLGKEDQLVELFKPKQPPRYMSQAEYDALPDAIVVREIRRIGGSWF